MLRLSIFKSAMNEEDQEDEEDNILQGTKLRKELVLRCDNMDRIF